MPLIYTGIEEAQDVSAWSPLKGSTLHLAHAAQENGYKSLVPISTGGKGAFIKGWTAYGKVPPTSLQLEAWAEDDFSCGWGYVHNEKLVAFDLDYTEREEVDVRLQWLLDNVDGMPMFRIGNWPKTLIVYRAGRGCFHRNGAPEIYFNKGQTVFFGIHPTINYPYRWQHGSPATRPMDDLPAIEGSQVMDFVWTFTGDTNYAPRSSGLERSHAVRKSSNAIHEMLDYARQAKIMIEGLESLGKVVASTAGMEGGRHFIMQRAVAYAWYQGHSRQRIEEIIGAAYVGLFTRDERRHRMKDVKDVLDWTEQKGKRA
jgi:hypothetical protein